MTDETSTKKDDVTKDTEDASEVIKSKRTRQRKLMRLMVKVCELRAIPMTVRV